jgi:hypothetical protein
MLLFQNLNIFKESTNRNDQFSVTYCKKLFYQLCHEDLSGHGIPAQIDNHIIRSIYIVKIGYELLIACPLALNLSFVHHTQRRVYTSAKTRSLPYFGLLPFVSIFSNGHP